MIGQAILGVILIAAFVGVVSVAMWLAWRDRQS